MTRLKTVEIAFLIFIAAFFILHALSMSFTQDDAFISYRYVKNYLDGTGLVFNPGERVEGYTNFFFIVLMIFFGRLGLDYILISKIIGISSGIGIICITFYWLKRILDRKDPAYTAFLAPLLLLSNSAFAYWAISGLETIFFTFLIFAGLYLARLRKMLFVPVLAVATLTRPEGAMIFGLVLLYFLVFKIYKLKRIGVYIIVYALLFLPHILFRWFYYNDFLPNAFYAKTGWSAEYFLSGLEYIWSFLKHYGFWGLILVLPAVFIKQIWRRFQLPLIIVPVYLIYIILVGGDVLYGARFFMPLLPLIYLIFVASLTTFLKKIFRNRRQVIGVSVAIIITMAGFTTYSVPKNWLESIRKYEKGLINSMTYQAGLVKQAGGQRFTVACTTIGAFSYYSDARIIDMLGLTDRTIAQNPNPAFGINSTWKERNYNIPYIMERSPDLILFSTGMKPSAPAEKALFLSSKFRKGYYPVFQESDILWVIYRRQPNLFVDDNYFPDAQFVNYYTKAINHHRDGNLDLALEYADMSIKKAPPDFYQPYGLKGQIYFEKGEKKRASDYFMQCLEISDGYAVLEAYKLAIIFDLAGDSSTAESYYKIVSNLNRIN